MTTSLGPGLPKDDIQTTSAPRLTPAFHPNPGTFQVVNSTSITRRFIRSSGLLDAVFGLNPTYVDVDFYRWTARNSTKLDNISTVLCGPHNSNVVACGLFQLSSGQLDAEATERQQRSNPSALFCTLIEDYRESSMFDVLGSIGGLLALLQGIHVFLFGRPLLWGIFGAKLITPFGLVGRWASRSFRQRLLNHYSSRRRDDANVQDVAEYIRMSRFLLDYVVDMGPADPTSQLDADDRPTAVSQDIQLDQVEEQLLGVERSESRIL